MATLPSWFVSPPVVGQADKYVVIEATTQAEYAQYQANKLAGPYTSLAAAQADANQHDAAAADPAGAFSGSNIAGTAQSAENAVKSAAGSALSGILPTFSNLRDLVVRAVKVLAGLALVIVGVSKMTGTDKAVLGAAKTAGKVAML